MGAGVRGGGDVGVTLGATAVFEGVERVILGVSVGCCERGVGVIVGVAGVLMYGCGVFEGCGGAILGDRAR